MTKRIFHFSFWCFALNAVGCGDFKASTLPSTEEARQEILQEEPGGTAELISRRYLDPGLAMASYATADVVGCTGTMIGPNVMMTAGHCRDVARTATFITYANGDFLQKRFESFNCRPLINTFPKSDLQLYFCDPNSNGENPGDRYGYLDLDTRPLGGNEWLESIWWNPVDVLALPGELLYSTGFVTSTNTTIWPAAPDTDPSSLGPSNQPVGISSNLWTQPGASGSSSLDPISRRIRVGPTSTGNGPGWQQLPGMLLDVGIGPDYATWGIGTDRRSGGYGIYRFTGWGWDAMPGAAVAIDVGPNGPWVVNEWGEIYEWVGFTFEKRPGQARDIGIGADGSVWMVGTNAQPGGYGIFKWNGTLWEQKEGAAVRISVDGSGNAWVVNDAGAVLRWNGTEFAVILGVVAHDIGVVGMGSQPRVMVVGDAPSQGDYAVLAYNWSNFTWEALGGAGVALDLMPNGNPWVLNSAQAVFRWRADSAGRQSLSMDTYLREGSVDGVYVSSDNTLSYGVYPATLNPLGLWPWVYRGRVDKNDDKLFDVQQDLERIRGENARDFYWLGFDSERRNALWERSASWFEPAQARARIAVGTPDLVGTDVLRHPRLNLETYTAYRVSFWMRVNAASEPAGISVRFASNGNVVDSRSVATPYGAFALNTVELYTADGAAELVFHVSGTFDGDISHVTVARVDSVLNFDTHDKRAIWRDALWTGLASIVPDGDGTPSRPNWAAMVAGPPTQIPHLRTFDAPMVPGQRYQVCFDVRAARILSTDVAVFEAVGPGGAVLSRVDIWPGSGWFNVCAPIFWAGAETALQFRKASGSTGDFLIDNISITRKYIFQTPHW